MLHKTKGVVLSFIKYRETSIIVKIYTELFGLQTFIENGVRSSKGKNKIALFQPLTLLDLVIYHDTKKEINRISEIKCYQPYNSISSDIKKTTLGIFINELLDHTLKEQTENQSLFSFIFNALLFLDHQDKGFENFHLYFLYKYCTFLGFGAETSQEIVDQLELQGIKFNWEVKNSLKEISLNDFGKHIKISRKVRIEIVEILLIYFRLHIDGFGEMKSLQILKEVLD
jgi:DNA repair protein RecO (recombination protein O)